jgi:hypothetical protein
MSCSRGKCRNKVKAANLCRRHLRESNDRFGNSQFAGNGKTKCYACGQPVVKHSLLTFCPFMDPMDVYTGDSDHR